MRAPVALLAALLLALALTACNDDPPPTQIYIVVTSTPAPVTPDTPTPQPTSSPGLAATITAAPTLTPATALAAPTGQVTPGMQGTPVPRSDLFPTDVHAQVQLAEQVFEHGRMFWIRHTREIWVMVAAADDPNAGDWYCYHDTFEEGEAEIDPSLIPPSGMYQPRRGFGKLWRSHPELREPLGWGITPEFELTSDYTYIAGGTIENGQYVRGLGEHRLFTLYNDEISFFEQDIRGECRGGTWRLTPSS